MPARVSGSVIITGKISYIDGNERKIVDFPIQTLTISNMAVINEAVALKKEEKPMEPVKEEIVKPVVMEVVKAGEPEKVEVIQEEPIKAQKLEMEQANANAKVPTATIVSAPLEKHTKYKLGLLVLNLKLKVYPKFLHLF